MGTSKITAEGWDMIRASLVTWSIPSSPNQREALRVIADAPGERQRASKQTHRALGERSLDLTGELCD